MNHPSFQIDFERLPLVAVGGRTVRQSCYSFAAHNNLGKAVPREPSGPPSDPVSIEQLQGQPLMVEEQPLRRLELPVAIDCRADNYMLVAFRRDDIAGTSCEDHNVC